MATNRRNVTSEDLMNEVLEKITYYTRNGFPEAKRLHEVIMATNPTLTPRLWYGMPGYAKTKDSAVLVFFRKDIFISFGFTESVDIAKMAADTPSCIPSAWYITKLDDRAEAKVAEVVRLVE